LAQQLPGKLELWQRDMHQRSDLADSHQQTADGQQDMLMQAEIAKLDTMVDKVAVLAHKKPMHIQLQLHIPPKMSA
jgi:hypothetical protein